MFIPRSVWRSEACDVFAVDHRPSRLGIFYLQAIPGREAARAPRASARCAGEPALMSHKRPGFGGLCFVRMPLSFRLEPDVLVSTGINDEFEAWFQA